jgi:hypothetical protein
MSYDFRSSTAESVFPNLAENPPLEKLMPRRPHGLTVVKDEVLKSSSKIKGWYK